MKKNDIIKAVADKTGFTKKDSEAAVEAVFDSMIDALSAGEKINVVGFGSFQIKERKARDGINPAEAKKGTVVKVKIPKTKVISFKAGRRLKLEVRK